MQVANTWEIVLTKPPHKGQKISVGSKITFFLSIFSLEVNLSSKNFQEKTIILAGAILSPNKGKDRVGKREGEIRRIGIIQQSRICREHGA